MSDPAQWQRERMLLIWQNWPSYAMRFAICTSILSASAWTGMANSGKPLDSAMTSVSLSGVLAACGQMRKTLHALEEANTQKQGDTPEPESTTISSLRSDNWTMDRHGTRWVLDSNTNQWKRSR